MNMSYGKILLLILFIILMGQVLVANEIRGKENIRMDNYHFSFAQNSDNSFFNTRSIDKLSYPFDKAAKMSADSNNKVKLFTGLAIAGTVTVGVSLFLLIPGIALTAYGYENRWQFSSDPNDYGWYLDYTTMYVGVGVFVLGMLVFLTGIPLMIVGWILRTYHKGKISVFMDSDIQRSRIGLAFKI
jgi:hypothetical protein